MFLRFDAFMIFLHSCHPQPIVFQWGEISVYWYGLLISAGLLFGLALILFLAKKFRLDKNHVWNPILYFVIFGVAGARVFYVLFYDFPYFWKNPLDIFKIWEGGLSIHGAVAAGLIILYFHGKKFRLSFWLLADIFSPALIFSQALGRWGNYFNQELFGRPTNLPWGIPIDLANRPENYLDFEYFHPVFLYESLWDFLIFGILITLIYTRINTNNGTNNSKHGHVFLTYLIFYSVGRFFLEFLRIDPQSVWFGLRTGQMVSLAVIAAAVLAFRAISRHGAEALKGLD